MKTMSFPDARAVPGRRRDFGISVRPASRTAIPATGRPPTHLTLATIRGWGDDYTPRRTPSTYDELVRVVIRILGERQDFAPDETLERRAQEHLATLGFDQPPPASSTHQRHDVHTASTPCTGSVEPAPLGTQVSPSGGGKAVLLAQLATHSGVDVTASTKERKQTARHGRVGKGRAAATATDAPPAPAKPRRRAHGSALAPALPSASAS